MSDSITLPAQFGWVVAAAATSAWLGLWQSSRVAVARRAAKIPYPQTYAEQAEVEKSEAALRFNCAQRAHANTLESTPYILTMAMIWGLKQPVYSAAALELWVLSKIWYTYGYINYGPKGRLAGGRLTAAASIAMLGGGSWAAFKFVTALC